MNIGERVGDYEIVAILGAGGMGQSTRFAICSPSAWRR